MLKLNYTINGIIINYIEENDNKKSKFIPYQAITLIGEIHQASDYGLCNIDGKYISKNVYSFYSFNIYLNDKTIIPIAIIQDKKSYPRLGKNYNQLSFFKKLFFNLINDNGISNEAEAWLRNEENIKDTYKNIENLRNDLINHFNKWKK